MDELNESIWEVFIEMHADRDLCRSMCYYNPVRFEQYCNVEEGYFVRLDVLNAAQM